MTSFPFLYNYQWYPFVINNTACVVRPTMANSSLKCYLSWGLIWTLTFAGSHRSINFAPNDGVLFFKLMFPDGDIAQTLLFCCVSYPLWVNDILSRQSWECITEMFGFHVSLQRSQQSSPDFNRCAHVNWVFIKRSNTEPMADPWFPPFSGNNFFAVYNYTFPARRINCYGPELTCKWSGILKRLCSFR